MEVVVTAMWLEDALKDHKLRPALDYLRLRRGHFKDLHEGTLLGSFKSSPVRCFIATGPRGGIQGVLLARRGRGWTVNIGVYVDCRQRRKGIGTKLVSAARAHYLRGRLYGSTWSDISSYFWEHVDPITTNPKKKAKKNDRG